MRPWEALVERAGSESEPWWTQGKSPAHRLPQACEIQEHLVPDVIGLPLPQPIPFQTEGPMASFYE